MTKFLNARKDPTLLQAWSTNILGEVWEEPQERIEGTSISSGGEPYTPDSLPDATFGS